MERLKVIEGLVLLRIPIWIFSHWYFSIRGTVHSQQATPAQRNTDLHQAGQICHAGLGHLPGTTVHWLVQMTTPKSLYTHYLKLSGRISEVSLEVTLYWEHNEVGLFKHFWYRELKFTAYHRANPLLARYRLPAMDRRTFVWLTVRRCGWRRRRRF